MDSKKQDLHCDGADSVVFTEIQWTILETDPRVSLLFLFLVFCYS